MMWCAVASSWLVAARTATVLPTPTSPVMTPRSDSATQKRMRATASWWLARSHSLFAGMVLPKRVLLKPKWVTHGARVIMADAPRRAGVGRHVDHAVCVRWAGRGRRAGRGFRRRGWPAPGPGSRRPRCTWLGLWQLPMDVAFQDERHRLSGRVAL